MAKRQRISATELGHMLDRPDRPVYVLSNEGVIVYFNEACRQWLGPGSEGLLGCRCAYHSSPDVTGPEAVAAALCPPPTVFSGQEAAASVCRVDEAGGAAYRRARFIPLGAAAGEVLGRGGDPRRGRPPRAACLAAVIADRGRGGSPAAARTAAALSTPDGRAVRHRSAGGQQPGHAPRQAQVALAAGSRASVLLVGPPGSGRQQMATAIHYGDRAGGRRHAGAAGLRGCWERN